MEMFPNVRRKTGRANKKVANNKNFKGRAERYHTPEQEETEIPMNRRCRDRSRFSLSHIVYYRGQHTKIKYMHKWKVRVQEKTCQKKGLWLLVRD